MPPATSATNTDTSVDHRIASEALESITRAESIASIGLAIAEIGMAIGLPHYLLLHFTVFERRLSDACHNLPGEVDVAALARLDFVHEVVARLLPTMLPPGLGRSEFANGFAVAAPHGQRACALLMGRGDRQLGAETAQQMGIALMAVTYAVDRLRVIAPSQQLSARELECLRYSAAGFSAKETARELGTSHRTVEEYLERSKKRLKVDTTIAAAVAAIRDGLISHAEIEALQVTFSSRSAAG